MHRFTAIIFLLLSTFAVMASVENRVARPFFPEQKERLDTLQENTPGAPLIDRDYDALGRLTRYQRPRKRERGRFLKFALGGGGEVLAEWMNGPQSAR